MTLAFDAPTNGLHFDSASVTAGAPYAQAVNEHASRNPLAFYVPGHGANAGGAGASLAEFFGSRALQLDVPPLVDGIDVGEESPRAEAMRLAAEAWGARRTWFLTNGSTQGNRTAALAVRGLGRDVLMQRSAHSSFVDGIILAGLRPGFVRPTVDTDLGIAHGVTPESVERAFAEHPGKPVAVYIVTPSYFGAVADVPAIAEVVHAHGAALIVDAAWGAHFGFHPELPESPLRQGADIAIMSTHKLTSSLTQSAMLHLGDGPYADVLEPLIDRAFGTTASTSESSLLLASLDLARRDLSSGAGFYEESIRNAERAREMTRLDGRFPVVSDGFGEFEDIVATDPFRIPMDIRSTGLDGHTVRNRLAREFDILVEMATASTIVLVVGFGKSPDLRPLLRALDALTLPEQDRTAAVELPPLPKAGEMRMLPRDAFFAETELVPVAEAIGRVSAASLAAYPPGIPNVLPGEEITQRVVEFLQAAATAPGGYVRGAADPAVEHMLVVAREDH
ncbi:amino acid decarboxylase [Gulosibacter macacae]|uniref:Amino acid decarboxylase n=1 Tax=Gulosibacter macacae TaxID=2488791 RepID=A0A3P3VYV8_9MICO|nr:DegT/DnrJ/EryC1/StrS family aminotransferase [Gulosibacter macacae]RRJ85853.1 amino acid decarboxylase [Gulosibacter macacae]